MKSFSKLYLPFIVILLALLILIATGYIGVGRYDKNFGKPSDFRFFYAAGKTWVKGYSPYDLIAFQKVSTEFIPGFLPAIPFAYPPNFSLLAVLLSLLPLSSAYFLIHFLNGVAVFLNIYISKLLLFTNSKVYSNGKPPLHWWIIPAIILANPFTSRVVWLGQITLWSCFFLVTSWYLIRNLNRNWAGGIFLALAGIKPQFLVLPLLWLFLEKRYKAIFIFCIVSFSMSLIVFIPNGILVSINDWLAALQQYQTVGPNMVGHENIIGIPSFLSSVGIAPYSTFTNLFIAIVITFLIFLFGKKYFFDGDILPILLCLHFLIIYGRYADLVYLLPVWISIWLHAQKFPRHWPFLFLVLLSFWFPSRIINMFDINWLSQWKVFSLFIATLYLIYQSVSLKRPNNNFKAIG